MIITLELFAEFHSLQFSFSFIVMQMHSHAVLALVNLNCKQWNTLHSIFNVDFNTPFILLWCRFVVWIQTSVLVLANNELIYIQAQREDGPQGSTVTAPITTNYSIPDGPDDSADCTDGLRRRSRLCRVHCRQAAQNPQMTCTYALAACGWHAESMTQRILTLQSLVWGLPCCGHIYPVSPTIA